MKYMSSFLPKCQLKVYKVLAVKVYCLTEF